MSCVKISKQAFGNHGYSGSSVPVICKISPVLISLSILPIHALQRCSVYKRICVLVLLFPVYRSPIHAAIPLSVQSSAYGNVCVLYRVIQGGNVNILGGHSIGHCEKKKVNKNMCLYQPHQNNLTPQLNG